MQVASTILLFCKISSCLGSALSDAIKADDVHADANRKASEIIAAAESKAKSIEEAALIKAASIEKAAREKADKIVKEAEEKARAATLATPSSSTETPAQRKARVSQYESVTLPAVSRSPPPGENTSEKSTTPLPTEQARPASPLQTKTPPPTSTTVDEAPGTFSFDDFSRLNG